MSLIYPAGVIGGPVHQIERSLRFNPGGSAFLYRTFGTPTVGSGIKWTWSGWIKRAVFGTYQYVISCGNGAVYVNESLVQFTNTDTVALTVFSGGTITVNVTTNAVFRDPAAWFHLNIIYDSGNVVAADRVQFWVNGIRGAVTVGTQPALNQGCHINQAGLTHSLGRRQGDGSSYNAWYLAEHHFIDGQAVAPSAFGQSDAATGVWVPKAYAGTYGNNGYYLKFADNSNTTAATLGKDSSPNGNNWTPANFSVAAGVGNNSLVDTPTNYGTDTGVGGEVRGNYCTLSSVDIGAPTVVQTQLSNLLLYAGYTASTWGTARGTIWVNSGKWYWEAFCRTMDAGQAGQQVGIMGPGHTVAGQTSGFYMGLAADGCGYNSGDGRKYNNSTNGTYGATFVQGDTIGVALDLDAGTLTFYKNNVSQGVAFSGLGGYWAPAVSAYFSAGNASQVAVNFGQRPFTYAAPSGFKALCAQNLPDPAIKTPSQYFDINLRAGTLAPFSVDTAQAFAPDFVWIKNRTGSVFDHSLWDTGRGVQNELYTPSIAAETVQAGGLTSFDSDGFSASSGTLARINNTASTYVDWMWKKGVVPGFDVVTYAGDGAVARTIAHGLGAVPKIILIRNRTLGTQHWAVAHASIATDNNIYLSLNNAQQAVSVTTSGGPTLSTSTSSVFGVKVGTGNSNNVNAIGSNYVAHLFADVDGFSKFGGYTGNNVADGPFVWCGFRPRWIMFKNYGIAAGWAIFDTSRDEYNPASRFLIPNTTGTEAVAATLDILSNGFKIKVAGGATNQTYAHLFAAFAENPFKYARAR